MSSQHCAAHDCGFGMSHLRPSDPSIQKLIFSSSRRRSPLRLKWQLVATAKNLVDDNFNQDEGLLLTRLEFQFENGQNPNARQIRTIPIIVTGRASGRTPIVRPANP